MTTLTKEQLRQKADNAGGLLIGVPLLQGHYDDATGCLGGLTAVYMITDKAPPRLVQILHADLGTLWETFPFETIDGWTNAVFPSTTVDNLFTVYTP